MEEKYIVTSYINPDLDGFSCMHAYKEFIEKCGKKAGYYIEGKPKKEVEIVCDMFNIKLESVKDIDKNDSVVLVDTNSMKKLTAKVLPESVTEIIDHHSHSNDIPLFKNANITIKAVGAAATIVAERFKEYEVDMSENSALLLYYGIVSNTINFKSNMTTDEDIEVAKWLKTKSKKIDDDKIRGIFIRKSEITSDLNVEMEANKGSLIFDDKKIMIGQLEITDSTNFILDNIEEIYKVLSENSAKEKVDYFLCNVIDILENYTSFVTYDISTQKMLEKYFNVKFSGNIAKFNRSDN